MKAIKIEHLWKEYRLGSISHGTLGHDLQSWWAKARGKEDPNSKLPMSPNQACQIEGDQFWALRDISLEVEQGDTLGIIGRNGSGKSTLLKLLSRVTAPTRGEIKINGRIASLLEVGTGFHPELTGKENVFLNGAILGMSKQEIRSKLEEIIEFSEVGEFVDTPVKRYSSGMYVRLAFSVAAHLEPEILIVDEVLAVGDAAFKKKCLRKMKEVSIEGRTILFVSHTMEAVEKLCDTAIWLEHGLLQKQGTSSEVIDEYLTTIISESKDVTLVGGTGEATVRSIRMVDENHRSIETVKVGQQVRLQVEVKAVAAIERLVFGYAIRNKLGHVMYGTNTHLKELPLYDVQPGDRYCFDIAFPVNLGPGMYSIDTALTKGKTHREKKYEWCEGSFFFNVMNIGKQHFVGCAWIDPQIHVSKVDSHETE